MSTKPRRLRNTAILPVPKLEEDCYDWHARHAAKVALARRRQHDVIFIGDSITHFFEGDHGAPGRGERVWRRWYRGRRVLNLGFGWDRTQNVLWRLEHGELDGQDPRLCVVLIGTNNLTGTVNARTNTVREIIAGIAAVCRRLERSCPSSRILIMGLLPRGAPGDSLRAKIRRINVGLRALARRRPGRCFLDLGPLFVGARGVIPTRLMADGVHPSAVGYERWARAIEPQVSAAVGGRRR